MEDLDVTELLDNPPVPPNALVLQKIVKHVVADDIVQYEVEWKDHGDEDTQWRSAEDLPDNGLIDAYKESKSIFSDDSAEKAPKQKEMPVLLESIPFMGEVLWRVKYNDNTYKCVDEKQAFMKTGRSNFLGFRW